MFDKEEKVEEVAPGEGLGVMPEGEVTETINPEAADEDDFEAEEDPKAVAPEDGEVEEEI